MGVAPLRLGTTEHARIGAGGRPAMRIGGGTRPLPLLSGPVGPESLRPRHPTLNTAADLKLVDAAFATIVALRSNAAASAPENLLVLAEAVKNFAADRVAAIRAFQRLEDIRDDQERQAGAIKPDGLTWQTLFTYAELARDLETLRDRKLAPVDYVHYGRFDPAAFRDEADRRFVAWRVPDAARYNSGSVPDMLDLLDRCARDPRIIDIRWIAYILATALFETSSTVKVPNAHGGGTHKVSRWAKPNEEDGKGNLGVGKPKLNYYLPVKVDRGANGGAIVTEQDGDTFTVAPNGSYRNQSRTGRPGAPASMPAVDTYARAGGVAHAYYGRGYCHLTWWNNYAATGAAIGLGLDLLFNPELALERSIAFEVMVHGMVYGLGFANGQRLQMYIEGSKCDYIGARRIVNGVDRNKLIALAAELFEHALMKSKK